MSGRPRRDQGMVTAEIAVALPALVLVAVFLIWGVSAASVQLACQDAARGGARAAARGESMAAVRALVAGSLPKGATVRVHRDVHSSRVEVAVPVRGPVAADLPVLTVRARATAITEPGATHGDTADEHRPPGADNDPFQSSRAR
jgi:hypothetical protein